MQNRALDLLRSVSALLVVLGHVRVLFFKDYADIPHSAASAIAYAFTSLGSEAVIVFFVMSGFWVGGGAVRAMKRRTFTWGGYASARLTRLWLVLIPALLLTILIDLVGRHFFSSADIYAEAGRYAAVPSHPTYSLESFFGTVAFLGGIHVPIFGLNMPLWSIPYEFWYYVMFPAAMLVFGFASGRWMRLVAALVLAASAFIAGGEALLLFPAWLAGAAVAWKRDDIVGLLRSMQSRRLAVLRIAALLGTLGAMVFAHEGPLPALIGKWLVALFAAALTATLVVDVAWSGPSGRILSSAAGTAHYSFSLYAIHMPIVALLSAVLVPDVADRWTPGPWTILAFLAIVVFLEVLAAVFASFTESKTDTVRGWMRAPLARSRRVDHAI
ncbi:acyltransferase family protein [Cryobacterium adonitolivorans]|nr:acyltransferase family protein [Cryobacterium adonitolivorans]